MQPSRVNPNDLLITKTISHSELRDIGALKFRRNARVHVAQQVALIRRAMEEFGWTTPVLIDEDNVVIAGYGRIEAARELGLSQAPVVVARGWSEAQKKAYMLADNQIALAAGWDEEILKLELDELELMQFDMTLLGFDARELKNMGDFGALERPVGNLADSFIIPPFSILDSKTGWWQQRKRAWLELGIQSELGRGDNMLRFSETILTPDPKKRKQKSTSKVDLNVEGMQPTPVQLVEGIYLKRDDLFEVANVRGGKVRTCWHLSQGAKGLVTAGSRSSPQVNIVAHIASHLGIPCRVHTPTGQLSPEVLDAKRCGAEVIQHKAGYNNVIIARAREDARAHGFTEIPFGMECWEAVRQTRAQFLATELPAGLKRIVIPVGSGMSLAGLLHGIEQSKVDLTVIGVKVGADPTKRLEHYAPLGWRTMVKILDNPLSYDQPARQNRLGSVVLDSIYEAKCLPFVEQGDMLWLVGLRATQSESARATMAAQGMSISP